MRIYTLAPGLFPRIVPDGGVTIGAHYIPAGVSIKSDQEFPVPMHQSRNTSLTRTPRKQTVISETIHSVHHNPAIFPAPETFDPERWLNDHDKVLEKFFVPYSKGSRICLGMK